MRLTVPILAVLLLTLTGCGGPEASQPTGPATDAFPTDVPQELKVKNPKDARGVPPCELLTPTQLRSVGLDPATARPDKRGLAEDCTWRYLDGSSVAGVQISTDPTAGKLPGFWRMFHNEPGFEILEVAGHPAMRADLQPDRSCSLGVAVADLQNLGVNAYVDRKPRPDPCAPARRIAELVLSNLPPLR